MRVRDARGGGEFIWGCGEPGAAGRGGGLALAAGLLPAGPLGIRADTGPGFNWRAVPCRPVGLECGPSTARATVPCQPEPNELRAGPG